MSTTKAFVTDWSNIERFVMDTAKLQSVPNTTREYLKQRLVSEEDHIVLITLSVLDSFVVNCGRSVRDEISSPVWMKILLNSFVTNLPKKHIRNAIQQMFSNWRNLVPNELLGQEARNVCKHMQSKNYVVPAPVQYSPAAVAAVAAGQSTTTFVRGFDFYKLVYGTVNDEEDTNVDHASSSTTTTHAVSSAPHVNSRPSTAELRAATGPATDTADVKLVRMHQDCTRLANATQACRETSAALLSSGGRAGHGGAVDQGLLTEGERRSAHGLECAAQCRSWSDAVQKMVHEGVSESLLSRTLEVNEIMCATLDAWEEVHSNLTRQLQSAAAGARDVQQQQHDGAAHSTASAQSSARSMGTIGGDGGSRKHLTASETAAKGVVLNKDDEEVLAKQGSAGNPFAPVASHPIVNLGSSPPDAVAPPLVDTSTTTTHQRRASSNNPFSSASDLASLDAGAVPSTAVSSTPTPSVDMGHAAAHAALHEQVVTLRNMLGALKAQHTQELAALQAEMDQSMSAMRQHAQSRESLLQSMKARAEGAEARVEALQVEMQEGQAARGALETQLRQSESNTAALQQQIEQLQAQLQKTRIAAAPPAPTTTPLHQPTSTTTPTGRVHSAVEWGMLAGKQTQDTASVVKKTASSRVLAHTDSLSAASSKGGVPQGAEAAAMLAAYRRMPALRVRFTPQHFASLVTTVLDER